MFQIANAALFILIAAAILVFQPTAFGETGKMLDLPIGLKIGDTANISSELKMTLLDVEDSRCPSDVYCVWEGTVTAKISLERGVHDLGIHNISLAMIEDEQMFDGYYIRLTNVEPYPESTNPIEPTDYVLTFFVSEGEADQLESPLKQFKNGIPANEIQCRDGFVLMVKTSDSAPSCVSFSTSEKLVFRGWGELAVGQSILPVIKTGTNSGFCIGYCLKDFVITPEKIVYIQSGRDFADPKLPQIVKQVPFSKAKWNELLGLVNFEKFSSLPDRIGCPGCADAPVEWIEITYGTQTKKIEFERGDNIPEIKDLILALQEIRDPIESTIESFDECVAAGNPVMESYPRQCRTDDGRNFVEEIDSQVTLQSQCKENEGTWMPEWNECEYISENQCSEMNGVFYECESACRHDPNAEMCTEQCVPVCVFP